MKDITKILNANPSLAKEVAKLLKEELENAEAMETAPVETTDLTSVQVPAGTNDHEVVAEAPGDGEVNNVTVAGEGHSVDADMTAVDPITPEQVETMVEEIPVEEEAYESVNLWYDYDR